MTETWLPILRLAVFSLVAVAVLAAAAAMAVQRRMVGPFGRPARLVRRATDPLLVPIERRLLRSGHSPRSAPWWLAGIAIAGGILVLTLAGWLAAVAEAWRAAAASRGLGRFALDLALWLFSLALVVRAVGSWLGGDPRRGWMRPFALATEWLLVPIRRVVPPLGPFDLSPFLAWFAVQVVRAAL